MRALRAAALVAAGALAALGVSWASAADSAKVLACTTGRGTSVQKELYPEHHRGAKA